MLKKFVLGGMVVVAALLGNACGGDDSSDSSPVQVAEESSSSVDEVLSSSATEPSGSAKAEGSSSSVKSETSSSSEKSATSSSSAKSSSSGKSSSSQRKATTKEEYYTHYDDTKYYSFTCGSDKYSVKGYNCKSNMKCVKDSVVSGQTCIQQKTGCAIQGNYFSSECCAQWGKTYTYKYSIKSNEVFCEYELLRSSSSVESFRSSSSHKSSSSSEKKSSSSSEKRFDWTVPKDAYLNPEIQYGSIVDERDGKVYKTIKIGNQEWMAENLNYSDSIQVPALKNKMWCYDNKAANCSVAGRLYTWAVAMDSMGTFSPNGKGCGDKVECTPTFPIRGICPTGWHLPDTTEWKVLQDEVEKIAFAGKVLKSHIGWFKNGNGSNDVGFSALPAGDKSVNGFYTEGTGTYFWCASETIPMIDHGIADQMRLSSADDNFTKFNSGKNNGASIRCLKDSE